MPIVDPKLYINFNKRPIEPDKEKCGSKNIVPCNTVDKEQVHIAHGPARLPRPLPRLRLRSQRLILGLSAVRGPSPTISGHRKLSDGRQESMGSHPFLLRYYIFLRLRPRIYFVRPPSPKIFRRAPFLAFVLSKGRRLGYDDCLPSSRPWDSLPSMRERCVPTSVCILPLRCRCTRRRPDRSILTTSQGDSGLVVGLGVPSNRRPFRFCNHRRRKPTAACERRTHMRVVWEAHAQPRLRRVCVCTPGRGWPLLPNPSQADDSERGGWDAL